MMSVRWIDAQNLLIQPEVDSETIRGLTLDPLSAKAQLHTLRHSGHQTLFYDIFLSSPCSLGEPARLTQDRAPLPGI
jgi:hypothetical protein